MSHLRLAAALLRTDLRILGRSRDSLILVILFAVLCVLLFAFGFLREAGLAADVLPGALWVTLLFASTVALLRLFAAEEEAGALDIVLRSRAGAAPLFFAKAATQMIVSSAVVAVILPVSVVFFDASIVGMGPVVAALGLGVVGLGTVGAVVAAAMMRLRLRELLVPLVLYPTVSPLLIAGVKVTAIALGGGDQEAIGAWLGLMGVFDLAFLALAPWIFARASG